MIDAEIMEQIIVDELTGRPQRNTSPEAKEFLEALKKDIALAEKKGWTIEIPAEILNTTIATPDKGK